MTSLVVLYVAGLVLACLTLYALLAGADFGGGVWDLLARGPRADDQRRLIEKAIGPVWEANHVWLIAVIVLLFACFPRAYAVIGTALHLPLTLMLFGVVLRGTAFVFRHYDTQAEPVWRAWSRAFAIASLVTPYMLGVCLGAATSGRIRVGPGGEVDPDLFAAWLAPFPLLTGAFVVAVFAFLAAVYLVHETDDAELKELFRARALRTVGVVTVLAWAVFAAAWDGAPHLVDGLWRSAWAMPFQGVTAALGAAIVHALWTRRCARARALSVVQVVAVVGGFGLAQWPHIVTPDVTFPNAAAPEEVLRAVAIGMTVGLAALAPAYAWMMRVFKGAP